MALRNLILLAISTFLISCGSEDKTKNSTTYKLDGSEYIALEEGQLTHDNDHVAGSGKLVFNAPLGETASGSHFRLTFTVEDGGSMTLTTYATNELEDGVMIVMARSGAKLDVTLSVAAETQDLSAAFAAIDANEEIALAFDVHNDEAPAHILAWFAKDATGDLAETLEDKALLNTEDQPSPGNGAGVYWGLALNRAVVTTATVAAPIFEEAE